ncbi:hypothetical protein [Pseudomonas sp. PSKL.D1]|uniref:hypothetical protein n=1 Tax=Pseudomonas sp. PSKL.D1 TaxID=3029060 RepID=UPI002380DB55|nr:hypothetical protein [Pseudomonas sp. PSKL.D1]WDY55872.1 hypothetical protein PVV54_14810 [Pseudomonas sp. PSKL.D1]
MNLSPGAAKALLDGGIDATAALNDALKRALLHSPAASHAELKRAVGHAMAGVLEATVDVAVQTYPDLKPDKETWAAIARECAIRRAN